MVSVMKKRKYVKENDLKKIGYMNIIKINVNAYKKYQRHVLFGFERKQIAFRADENQIF